MTDAKETTDQFDGGPYAIVEALIDGERVDPQSLKDALADAAARDHFVELLMLREAVGAMVPPGSAIVERGHRSSRLGWLAAAAAVLISVAAGYVLGQRVVTPVAAQSVEAIVQVQTAPAAPTPTRIITLRPGINWTESSGGR
jgi:hypothetical protein